jgi:hypothetical protein
VARRRQRRDSDVQGERHRTRRVTEDRDGTRAYAPRRRPARAWHAAPGVIDTAVEKVLLGVRAGGGAVDVGGRGDARSKPLHPGEQSSP